MRQPHGGAAFLGVAWPRNVRTLRHVERCTPAIFDFLSPLWVQARLPRTFSSKSPRREASLFTWPEPSAPANFLCRRPIHGPEKLMLRDAPSALLGMRLSY